MGQWMDGYLERLKKSRQECMEAGGKDRIAVQHDLGKLTAHERIERLVDPGTFEAIGSQVRESSFSFGMGRREARQMVCLWALGGLMAVR